MADFTALKTAIQNAIKQNGNEEITGAILQEVMLAVVSTLGDSAINDLVAALNTEVTNRQNADGTLQSNINAEQSARQLGDSTLQSGINNERDLRIAADNAMQSAITTIGNHLNEGYIYVGIATTATNPSTPIGKVFYFAVAAGTYTNFLNSSSQPLVLTQGINILKYNGTSWSVEQIWGVDDNPTAGSNKLVKSGGVFNDIMTNGSAFDLSAYNNGTTYADLNAALTALNALPAAYKKGGMSMKYVQTSDNKYVQYRLTADEWSVDTEDWQQDIETIPCNVFDMSISDGNGNHIVGFYNGHVKTKNFDSSKNASESERGLMSSSDKEKLNTIEVGAEVNNTESLSNFVDDFDIRDERNYIILALRNGHVKTKNFDSSESKIEEWSKLPKLDENNPISCIMQTPGFGRIFRDWGFIGDSLSAGETWGGYDKVPTINVAETDKKITSNGIEDEIGSVVTEQFVPYGYQPKITITFSSDVGLESKIIAANVQSGVYTTLCIGENGKTSYTFDAIGIIIFSYQSNNQPSYRFTAKYVKDDYEISWGQYLCRLFNVTGYNYATGGETARVFCTGNNNGRRFNNLETDVKESYFIALGQNDSNLFLGGGNWSDYPCVTSYPNASDYTELLELTKNDILNDIDFNDYSNNQNSFAGYYCRIIQKIKDIQPKGYIFLVTDPYLLNTDNSIWNDCIRLIYDIFKERYSDSIWLIDLDRYITNIDEIQTKIQLNGLHSSAFGYCYVSYIMNTYLDWIIRNNIDAFRRTSLIGTSCDY